MNIEKEYYIIKQCNKDLYVENSCCSKFTDDITNAVKFFNMDGALSAISNYNYCESDLCVMPIKVMYTW